MNNNLKESLLEPTNNRAPKITKKKSIWEDLPDRNIQVNQITEDYKTNYINTSRYSLFTFVPKNIYEQFSKLANFYFLIIGFLQTVDEISTSGGIPVIFFPLTVIVTVSGLKDLFEDLKRKRSDNDENNRKIMVLENDRFVNKTWRDLRVGSIVKISENEYLPADLLLIQSSDEKNLCYIETKNLDGETNLKRKIVNSDFDYINGMDEKLLSRMNLGFQFEKPNPFLYTFKGCIVHSDGKKTSLDQSNFILRGCSLRNTHFIVGVIAYTGHETKIMLNSTKARSKVSKLSHFMNKQIILIFIMQLIFCLFCSFYGAFWFVSYKDELAYLEINEQRAQDSSFSYNFFVRAGSWLIIFQNFVPISLIVTLEMVKFVQGIFISKNNKMKSEVNGFFASVNSSSLNEELGQVQYIFSDKTGTLTCNFMEFKKISIQGISYGEDQRRGEVGERPIVTNVDFKDKLFFDILEREEANRYSAIKETLFAIALCHTIITEKNSEGEIVFNASSPDELALINWAKFCGCEFKGVDKNNNMIIEFKNFSYKFQVLQVLEFNSSRKRQSVILRDEDGAIILYTKGADSVIEKRLKIADDPHKIDTWENLETYASTGLRTLVVAKRMIKEEEYVKWSAKYLEATTSIDQREEKMDFLQNEIEMDFELIAATAIEDKLQPDVGLTIEFLKQAGIKFWMLTGDKIETAINIGYSCQLINDIQNKVIIDGNNPTLVEKQITDNTQQIKSQQLIASLIISGDALIYALKDNLASKLLELAELCRAVIACRVSPKQKQEIVTMVKTYKKHVTTLAIGDGANDVNMITAAHVGVGIRGVEGQQAARASDYVLGEFKLLRRLLLYYGRESYRRNSNLICYNFFKNMVLVIPQFWFGFLNGFSGQNIYNPFLYQLYNILHSSFPIVIYGLLDKEYSGRFLMLHPSLYINGMKNKLFNLKVFWRWIFGGFIQSLIITIPTYLALGRISSDPHTGEEMVFWGCGMSVYGAIIIVTNIKIMIFSHTYSVLNFIFITISITSYYVIFWFTSQKYVTFGDYGTAEKLFGSVYFYALVIMVIAATNLIDYAMENFKILSIKNLLIEEEERKRTEEIELEDLNDSRKSEIKYTGYAYSQEDQSEHTQNFYRYAEN